MSKEFQTESIINAVSQIENTSMPPLGKGGLTSVAEISRMTSIPSRVVLKEIALGNIETESGSVAQLIDDIGDITNTIFPSKTRDRIISEIESEGQRYARRAQFPQDGTKGQPTRKKVESRILNYQIDRAKIRLVGTKDQIYQSFKEINSDLQPKREMVKENAPIQVVNPQKPEEIIREITKYFDNTRYWSNGRKQKITPDILFLDDLGMRELSKVVQLETTLLINVMMQYKKDITEGRDTKLTKAFEGPLANSPAMQTMREWMGAIPEKDILSYYRLDLGVASSSNRRKFFIAEATTISCGTADAILYREAQNNTILANGLKTVGMGSLQYFFDRAAKRQEQELVIVGTTPFKPSQLLYEKSHSDMARELQEVGVNSSFSRLTDFIISDGQLFTEGSATPVTDIYWIGDPFFTPENTELDSPQGKLLLNLYKAGEINITPTPCFPFSDNKLLEALVWNDDFSTLVPKGLREFIPRTEVVTKQNETVQGIIDGKLSWKNYVLKKAITLGGGQGVLIGFETQKDKFKAILKKALQDGGTYIIQEFIQSEQFKMRLSENGVLKERRFFLRLEPTISVSEGETEIQDLLFTGRYDTRKVGGSSNCIMGTVATK